MLEYGIEKEMPFRKRRGVFTMEKKNFSAASVLVAMLIASGHFAQASASKDDHTGLQTTENGEDMQARPLGELAREA